MIYKVISNLKTGEGTFVAGDKIEMDEETAKHLIEDGVLMATCEGEEEEPEVDLKDLTIVELKDLAEEKEIDIFGAWRKADIIKAIKKALK